MKRIAIILIFVIILGAFGTGVYYYTNKDKETDIRLYGTIDIRQVDIGFQVSGLLASMLYEEGEHVEKGALLAELNNKDYLENNNKALAEIKRLTAIRDEAQSVVDTYTPLKKEGYTSKRTYTSYQNKLTEAQSALESAIITQRIMKNQLEYTKIYAPESGVITVRVQEPGAMLQTGQIVYTLAKDQPIWVRSYIPERYLANIAYGTKAIVLTDSIDPHTHEKRQYRGHVGYISPVAEFTPKSVQTEDLRPDLVYRIHIYIDEADSFLKQGMPVTIMIDNN